MGVYERGRDKNINQMAAKQRAFGLEGHWYKKQPSPPN
jgi:hypothetical protein